MSGMNQPASAIRSRDKALDLLLPKFLWIVCSLGTPSGTGRKRGVKAIIDAGLELHASPLRPYRIVASVYALTERAPLYKVFSVHLAVASAFVDPQFFTYQAGRCGILSWKRDMGGSHCRRRVQAGQYGEYWTIVVSLGARAFLVRFSKRNSVR